MIAVSRFIWPLLAIITAVAIASSTIDADSNPRRATVHLIVALGFSTELVSMIIRTGKGQWDQLAIWMALFRAAVVNYFALLAINFYGFAVVPDGFFSVARAFLAISGTVAFFILAREDYYGYRALSVKRRLAATAIFCAVLAFFVSISLVW